MAPRRSAQLNLQTTSILVIGAAEFELDVIVQILVGFGIASIQRADAPSSALEILQSYLPDFVLFDCRPNDPDLLDFIRKLRRLSGEVRRATVLAAVAYSTLPVLRDIRDAGADFVVAKPLTPLVLFERMKWLAENPREFIEAETYVGPDRRLRTLGPPPGVKGRRAGDLSAHLGEAKQPNMSQGDIDALFTPRAL